MRHDIHASRVAVGLGVDQAAPRVQGNEQLDFNAARAVGRYCSHHAGGQALLIDKIIGQLDQCDGRRRIVLVPIAAQLR